MTGGDLVVLLLRGRDFVVVTNAIDIGFLRWAWLWRGALCGSGTSGAVQGLSEQEISFPDRFPGDAGLFFRELIPVEQDMKYQFKNPTFNPQ